MSDEDEDEGDPIFGGYSPDTPLPNIASAAGDDQLSEFLASLLESEKVTGDVERTHVMADAAILAELRGLGYARSVEAWLALDKWYS